MLKKKNKIKVFFICLVLLTSLGKHVTANTKLSHYESVFRNWGFNLNDSFDTDKEKNASLLDGYSLILTSQLNLLGNQDAVIARFNSVANAILICDSDTYNYDYPHCVDDTIAFENYYGSRVHLVPSTMLATPTQRESVEQYFISLYEAESTNDDTKLFGFESTKYLSLIFMLFVIVVSFTLIKQFDSAYLFTTFSKIRRLLQDNNYILLSLLAVMTVIYLFLGYIASYNQLGELNIEFGLYKVVDPLLNNDLGNVTNVVLFFYNLFFVVVVLAIILPDLFIDLKVLGSKINSALYANDNVGRFVPFIIWNLLIFGYFITAEHNFYKLATPLVLVLAVFVYRPKRLQVSVLIILFSTFIVSGIFGYFLQDYSPAAKPLKVSASFVPSKYNTVFLPFSHSIVEGTYFESFMTSADFALFANDYLLYYPKATEIINTAYTPASLQKDYVLINDDSTAFLSKVLQDFALFSALRVDDTNLTSTFVFDGTISKGTTVVFGIDCTAHPAPQAINTNIVSYNGLDLTKIDKTAVFFPGCADYESEHIYAYELPNLSSAQKTLVSFTLDPMYLTKLDVVRNTEILPITFLNYYSESKFISANVTTSQPVYALRFGTLSDYTFKSKKIFDLATLVNKLLQENIINDNLVIWTQSPNAKVLVRTDD